MKSFKKLGGIIGVVGCLQFLIFSTIAMFNYTEEHRGINQQKGTHFGIML